MNPSYKTDLYNRIHAEIRDIAIIDTHEHLQRESELPRNADIHIGRFFAHYANSDLVSAGMPVSDMEQVQTNPEITPRDRWRLLEPWYKKSYNTAYCEALRIAIREIYDTEDFSTKTVE